MSNRAMDNFRVLVKSLGDDDLQAIIKFIMKGGRRATHWSKVDGEVVTSLVFYWAQPSAAARAEALPPASAETLFHMVKGWLKHDAEYGPEPDIDGSCSHGFVISAGGPNPNEETRWDSPYTLFHVMPVWALHGK